MSNILLESFKNFSESLKETYIKKADIVNNLDSTDANKPLSANMGNDLKIRIDNHNSNTIISSEGLHNIRYYNNIFSIKDEDGNWIILQSGGEVDKSSDNNFSDYYRKKLDGIEDNANFFDISSLSKVNISILATDSTHRTVTESEKTIWSDKYTKNEIDTLLSGLALGLVWKEQVTDYDAILSTYPSPEENWTVATNDGSIYTYNGENWIKINSSTIPAANENSSGLLTPSLYLKLINIEKGANKYVLPTLYCSDIVDDLEKVMMTKDERSKLSHIEELYRLKETKIVETDIDAEFLKKLANAGGTLIRDDMSDTATTYSSSKIDELLNALITESSISSIDQSEIDSWLS